MIQIQNLTKIYTKTGNSIRAIDNISLQIQNSDFVVVHGPSGSGKSSLLLMLGGMLRPTSGTVLFRGENLYAFSQTRRNLFRRNSVGFIFQKYFLMPYLSVYDNIRLRLTIRGLERDISARIATVTQQLGISSRLQHYPAELSVGEQQRVAMARTLASDPELILADEPTGNLDRANKQILAQTLREEHEQGRAIILVTHDESLMELGTSRIHLVAGRIANQQCRNDRA